MKALIGLIFGLFGITAIITHIWTTYIAFTVGGFIAGIVTLFLPAISEIYWMFRMFGENDTYAYIALIHLILAIPYSLLSE